MIRAGRLAFGIFALGLAACSAGAVHLTAVVPATTEDVISEIDDVHIQILDQRGEEVSSHRAAGLAALRVTDLADGRFTFVVTAHDRSGRVVLEGQSAPVDVARRTQVSVAVLLAPVEEISRLPVQVGQELADEISARCDLAAARIDGDPTQPDVLISGGAEGGEARADAWIYSPTRLAFDRAGAMACPRARHRMVAVTRAGTPQILIVGGGSTPCRAAPGTAANTIELFEPSARRFRVFEVRWLDPDLEPVEAPDLSNASIARMEEDLVFVAVAGSAWLLDVAAATAIQYWVALPASAELDAISLFDLRAELDPTVGDDSSELDEIPELDGRGVALLTGGTDARLSLFDARDQCASNRRIDIPDEDAAMVGLRWGGVLITSGDRWWSLDTNRCDAPSVDAGGCWAADRCSAFCDPSTDQCALEADRAGGELDPPRARHTATALPDDRVLIVGGVGGDAPAPTSLFAPPYSRRNEAPALMPGPLSAHTGAGHVVVSLADGAALIAGCGAPAEVFNPRRQGREIIRSFTPESRPDDALPLKFVLAVDASETGRAIRAQAEDAAPDMVSPDWGAGVVEVGVIPTDLGSLDEQDLCDTVTGEVFPAWIGDPDFVDPVVDDAPVRDRIRSVDETWAGARCPVQQPMLLSALLWFNFLGLRDSPFTELNEYPGEVLFVAQMGTDDGSMLEECAPGTTTPRAFCDDAGWLLDPEGLAAQLLETGHGAGGFEILLIWDDGNGETCAVPERLARYEAAMGDAALLAYACTTGPDDLASFLMSRVKSRAFRRACVSTGRSPEEPLECQVSVSYSDGTRRFVKALDPAIDWRLVRAAESCSCERWVGAPDPPPRCADVTAGEDREYALLEIDSAYSVPAEDIHERFERFEYVCW